MKRTTIFIPETLEADLQRYARRSKKPAAWVVREAIAAFLASHTAPISTPSTVGMGESGRGDLSERFDELLFADLTPHADQRARRAPSRTRPRTRRQPAK
jgi:predicted transcriptional regulator